MAICRGTTIPLTRFFPFEIIYMDMVVFLQLPLLTCNIETLECFHDLTLMLLIASCS